MTQRILTLGALLLTACDLHEQRFEGEANATPPDSTPLVVVDRPTVIGFFPPAKDSSEANEDGYVEGVAHVVFALQDAEVCLGRDSGHVELVIDTAVRIQRGMRVDTLRFSRVDSLSYGAYLIGKTSEPQLVSVHGPSQLIHAVPAAIPAYFRRPPCKESS